MCLLLCCQSVYVLFCLVPYLWLFIMPIYGAFCGTQPVFRLSLILCFHTVVMSYVPRQINFLSPYIQTLCFIVSLWIPLSWLPDLLVFVYSVLAWTTEPLWLCLEVAIVLWFIMHVSDTLLTYINEDDDQLWPKVTILSLSGLSYVMTFSLAITFLRNDSVIVYWFVIFILLFAALGHFGSFKNHDGFSCDAACIGVVSMALLLCWRRDIQSTQHPLPVPDVWSSIDGKESLLRSMFSLPLTSIESANRSIAFIKKLFSVVFLAQSALRLYSVHFLVDAVHQYITADSEQEDSFWADNLDEEEVDLIQKWFPSRLPLMFKLSMIFVYTQTVTYYLGLWSASPLDDHGSWYAWLNIGGVMDLCPGRLLQIVMLNMSYLWRLYISYQDMDVW